MNLLLFEMGRSLVELDSGLKGDLSISEPMEALMDALYDDRCPPSGTSSRTRRCAARPVARRPARAAEAAEEWTADLATPKVTWLSGLFNPQAFLTAVMQVTARKNEWPLDKLVTVVEVSKKAAERGRGARATARTPRALRRGRALGRGGGRLDDAIMKQLYPPMPLMLVKAATPARTRRATSTRAPST